MDCEGRSGGLALMWKDDIKLFVLSYSKHHIDALIISNDSNNTKWHITGVYGHPDIVYKTEIWNLIMSLFRADGKAWLVFGDFNESLKISEKWG